MKKILISNDDGILSPFLNRFIEAFEEVSDEILVVVPASEQSWIGRAYSRHKNLTLAERKSDFKKTKIHTVDGTPSDCVNIALGCLCKDDLPDVVVSGINIGQNLGLPLLWSSGTFSAAAEAAGAGVMAVAASLQLANEFYEACRINHETPPKKLDDILRSACAHCANFVREKFESKDARLGSVFNINYPSEYSSSTQFVECEPASVKILPFYRQDENGKFSFKYAIDGGRSVGGKKTDIECLKSGVACYSSICVRP